MAKTSDSVSNACSKVEIQPGCTGSWYDAGGELSTITVPKSTRNVGQVAVLNDPEYVIAGGKMNPVTVTLNIVYSEIPTEAYFLMKDLWETPGVSDCDKQLCIRWIPKGGSAGDAMYQMTRNPQFIGFQYPSLDAGSAEPITCEADVFGYIDSSTFVS